jgi:hypothetical protein
MGKHCGPGISYKIPDSISYPLTLLKPRPLPIPPMLKSEKSRIAAATRYRIYSRPEALHYYKGNKLIEIEYSPKVLRFWMDIRLTERYFWLKMYRRND